MVKEINSASPEACSFYAADLRTKGDCQKVVQAAIDAHGRVDALVHAAGIFPQAALVDTTDEMWSECMKLHVDAFFYLSRQLAPFMMTRGSGSLLAIASNYGMVGAAHAGAYAVLQEHGLRAGRPQRARELRMPRGHEHSDARRGCRHIRQRLPQQRAR